MNERTRWSLGGRIATAAAFGLWREVDRLESWSRFYRALGPVLTRELNDGADVQAVLARAPEPARAAFADVERHERQAPAAKAATKPAAPKPPQLAPAADVRLFALPADTRADELETLRACMKRYAFKPHAKRAAEFLAALRAVAAEHPHASSDERVERVGARLW